jgi:hypothetical protein
MIGTFDGANGLEHVGSTHVRQAEIKHDKIGPCVNDGAQSRSPGIGFANNVTLKVQACTDETPYLRLILDQENDVSWVAHRSPPVRVAQRSGMPEG